MARKKKNEVTEEAVVEESTVEAEASEEGAATAETEAEAETSEATETEAAEAEADETAAQAEDSESATEDAGELSSNEGKNLRVEVDGVSYDRLPIRTHVVTDADDICDVAEKYATPYLKQGDILFISEKCVACTQKRAIPMKDIKPRKLAVFLSRYVTKSPHGIGLGIPETMEYALKECGTIRILFAAFVSVIGKKIFHKSGWFYAVAGKKAASIDGPCHNTIPPYNEYVVLGPKDPQKVSCEIATRVKHKVLIVDLNDLGGDILGRSHKSIDKDLMLRILKDNPLGQCKEQTPMGIIRKATN